MPTLLTTPPEMPPLAVPRSRWRRERSLVEISDTSLNFDLSIKAAPAVVYTEHESVAPLAAPNVSFSAANALLESF